MTTYPDANGSGDAKAAIDAVDALSADLNRFQRATLRAVIEAGWVGLTLGELATWLEVKQSTIGSIPAELESFGLIRDSGQQRGVKEGKRSIVWIAA